ncbi:hypothetical protein Hdeb2414_s0015g00448431 [Helianthus debilis subsp. tardiflorus]
MVQTHVSDNLVAKEAKPAPHATQDKEVKGQKSNFSRISQPGSYYLHKRN